MDDQREDDNGDDTWGQWGTAQPASSSSQASYTGDPAPAIQPLRTPERPRPMRRTREEAFGDDASRSDDAQWQEYEEYLMQTKFARMDVTEG